MSHQAWNYFLSFNFFLQEVTFLSIAYCRATQIRMWCLKLLSFVLILQCAEGSNSEKEAADDISKIWEIMSTYHQEIQEMKQNLADQRVEHEMSKAHYLKEITELRQIIMQQNGLIKEQDGQMKMLRQLMTKNNGGTLEKDNDRKTHHKTPNNRPRNISIEELEQRVDDLEVAMLDVREDIFDIGADVVRVSADVLVAEQNIEALENEDAAKDDRISVLETTVNDYLDVAVGFHVALNSGGDQILALGDVVMFDTILTNYGEAFNLSSSSFVAPRHGLYGFSAYFLTSKEGLATHLCVAVNADCVCKEYADYNHNKYETGTCSVLAELLPGDMVNIVLNSDPQSDGGEVNGHGYTGFTGWLYKAL